jgi:hypothetical protein
MSDYQYAEDTLQKASEIMGRPISNEEFFMLRAEAIAYFRHMGIEHTKKVMGGTPIGDNNIKMIFNDV